MLALFEGDGLLRGQRNGQPITLQLLLSDFKDKADALRQI